MMRKIFLVLGLLLYSTLPLYGVVGCGPGTDNSTCGNVGDPYEGGAPPGGTSLNACLNPMVQNTAYYLANDVNAATPADICFGLRNGVTLDLRGHIVTGRLDMTGLNANGITIFNGIVNATAQAAPVSPIKISSASNYTAKTRLHHLTVHASGDPGNVRFAAIYLAWTGLDGTNTAMEVDHITGYVETARTSNRAEFMFIGNGKKTDIHNNDLTCNADVAACNLIEAVPAGEGYSNGIIRNNKVTITGNTVSGGFPRAIVISGQDVGEIGAQGWQVYSNYCDANTTPAVANRGGRCFRFRQVNDLSVHDNQVAHCANLQFYGCYHFGDPSTSTPTVAVTTGTNLVAQPAGYTAFASGWVMRFNTGGHGVTAISPYWVCNANASTFQIDATSNACANIVAITSSGTNKVFTYSGTGGTHTGTYFVSDSSANIYNEAIALDAGGVAFWATNTGNWATKNSAVTGTHGQMGYLDVNGAASWIPTTGTFCGITGSSGLDVNSTVAATATAHTYLDGTWGGAGTWDQMVSCPGVGGAAVTLAPTTLAFGNQVVPVPSAAQDVTLTNSGTATLNITSFTVTGTNSADFGQTHTCGATLAAAASCTISVTFTPSALGVRSASVSIVDDAADSPQSIPLSGTGTGTPTVVLSPTTLAYGSAPVGGISQIVLQNTGNTTLHVTSIVASASFTETNDCGASVAAAASCTITVSPVVKGPGLTGTLTVTTDAASSPDVANLTADGYGQAVGGNVAIHAVIR